MGGRGKGGVGGEGCEEGALGERDWRRGRDGEMVERGDGKGMEWAGEGWRGIGKGALVKDWR